MKKIVLGMSLFMVLAVGVLFVFTSSAFSEKAKGNMFTSRHIDDAGVRAAVKSGKGQELDQKYVDQKHDITVRFKRVLTDDKETKLLLTFQSDQTNLKNYHIDLFEGASTVKLHVGDKEQLLKFVGWGSRYYSKKENKVYEALSFDSIKGHEGQNVRLEIKDLTIYKDRGQSRVQTTWPIEFEIKPSATLERKTVEVNKTFTFKDETYTIENVAFSALETSVVVTGSDVQMYTDESGEKYEIRSKLEKLFMNPRKSDGESGYRANKQKTGVFLKSADKKVVPIYSKEEVHGEDNYVMAFAPVKNRQHLMLEVGKKMEIPLTK